MSDLTRRSFLKGIGAISVTLLFRRELDAALSSLEEEFTSEPPSDPSRLPTAADIMVTPQLPFRPERIIASPDVAHLFVIERITIGGADQLAGDIPAALFAPHALDAAVVMSTASPTAPLCFRVRYVGTSRDGARFIGAIIGSGLQDRQQRRLVLPLESIQLGA